MQQTRPHPWGFPLSCSHRLQLIGLPVFRSSFLLSLSLVGSDEVVYLPDLNRFRPGISTIYAVDQKTSDRMYTTQWQRVETLVSLQCFHLSRARLLLVDVVVAAFLFVFINRPKQHRTYLKVIGSPQAGLLLLCSSLPKGVHRIFRENLMRFSNNK